VTTAEQPSPEGDEQPPQATSVDEGGKGTSDPSANSAPSPAPDGNTPSAGE